MKPPRWLGPRWLATGIGALCVTTLDLASLLPLIVPSSPPAQPPSLALLLLLHAACALATAALLPWAAPRFLRRTAGELQVFAACLTFFLPVVGPLGVLAILRSGSTEPREPTREPWVTHGRADALEERRRRSVCAHRRGASAADVRSALSRRAPESAGERFRAVLATRHLPPKIAVGLLKVAQRDPTEEVRLYAFSRLEGMRDEIEERIDRLDAALGAAGDEDDAARIELRLAESYWELGRSGLVEGAVLDHALSCARRHATSARERGARPAAEFFLGKILLELREPGAAAAAFEAALEAGYPRRSVLSHLAECAFRQKDFASVRSSLSEVEAASRRARPEILEAGA